MKKYLSKKVLTNVFAFLVAIAPVLALTPKSTFVWGEVEIPESLKH
jgi:cyclic lactone autoinducer peptide